VNKEKRMLTAKILQAQGLTQIEISRRLGVCDRTIRNYLKADITQAKRKKRTSKLDPYYNFIKTILEDNPHYNCELIYEKLVASGYTGHISILRDLAKKIRNQILTDAVIRFETTPGLQAQVDWKEFGTQQVDGSLMKLYSFTMTLGYPYDLEQSVQKIARRFGTDCITECIDAIRPGGIRRANGIALDYYDRTYDHGLSKRENASIVFVTPEGNDSLDDIAGLMI